MPDIKNLRWLERLREQAERVTTQTLRVGVTGLSGAGKTTFITGLINQLENHQRGLLARRKPFDRLTSVRWLRDGVEQPFAFLDALAALSGEPPRWPDSTKDLARVVIELQFAPAGLLRSVSGTRHVRLELLDYPGEWLLDLPLLNMSYGQWCERMTELLGEEPRLTLAGDMRAALMAVDPGSPCEASELAELTRQWTDFMRRCQTQAGLSRNQPGRFLLPGTGVAADMLMFVPLLSANRHSQAQVGSWWAQCEARFNYYRDFIVKGFYDQHFSRLDSQILLVDMLSPMQGGRHALHDLQCALESVMGSFRYGSNSLFSRLFRPRISRMAVCATKVDQIAPVQQRALQQCLEDLVTDSIAEVRHGGVRVLGFPLAAVRAAEQDGDTLVAGLVGETAYVRYEPGKVPEHLPLNLDMPGLQLLHLRPPPGLHRNRPFPHYRMDDLISWIFEGRY